MAWSASPIPSLIQIHNENMATGYADNRTLTSQPHIMTPSPPAYHVWTVIGERSLETSSGNVNMCVFQLREDPPPSPSPLLPTGSNPEVSPKTIDSSLVTVINKDEIPTSNIDSLDDVSSLPHDARDFLSETSSSVVLPDPSPFLTYVRQPLPLPERPQVSPRKKRLQTKNILL